MSGKCIGKRLWIILSWCKGASSPSRCDATDLWYCMCDSSDTWSGLFKPKLKKKKKKKIHLEKIPHISENATFSLYYQKISSILGNENPKNVPYIYGKWNFLALILKSFLRFFIFQETETL